MSEQPKSTGGGDVHDWGPLVSDLAARRERAIGDGRRAVRRTAALARQAHRARAARPAARPRDMGRVRDARRPHGPGPRRSLPRGRRRGHGHRRDRRPSGCGRGVRLHGDGRVDGQRRREQDPAHASPRDQAAHPDGLAARFRRRPDPSIEWLDVRRRRRSVPRAGRDERCRADGRGDARALRGGDGLHPCARRLRADGEGHVVDGARRPAPREGRGRRRRDRGGDGRLRRSTPRSAASPISRWPTTPSACGSCASTSRSSRSTTRSVRPVVHSHRPRRPSGRGALRHRPDRASARVRRAQGDHARSSTTASSSR